MPLSFFDGIGAIESSDFGQKEQALLQTSIKLNSIQLGIGTPLDCTDFNNFSSFKIFFLLFL